MPKVLIAADKFKGSLSAMDVCEAIQRGLGDGWECDVCPIADGGEGFTEAMVKAGAGKWVECPCVDALGREVTATYGVIASRGKTMAVMEMAAASGMWRIGQDERDVMRSSTYGVGQMMMHAQRVSHVEEILIGIGGSATNDGGAGMAEALGVKFFDQDGRTLRGVPCELVNLARMDRGAAWQLPRILVACDVGNPLCGLSGASHVYGPQKGATLDQVSELDALLHRMAEMSGSANLADCPGAGAAGGLGFGLMAFTGAELFPGFGLVADALDLSARVLGADVIITGEGSLDEQSLNGKGPMGVAQLARAASKPCVAFAGRIDSQAAIAPHFDLMVDILSLGHGVEKSMSFAKEYLAEIVHRSANDLLAVLAMKK